MITSNITSVQYHLHETFRNPNVTSFNKENNFEYRVIVWGSFPITATVNFEDGSKLTITKDFYLEAESESSNLKIK